MSIFVDPAIWPWRGDRWAHLISDVSEPELHEFAERLGLRRLSFQGDHYDVSVDTRRRALDLGAEPITSRELVSRLRASGLRRRHKVEPWVRQMTREAVAADVAIDGLDRATSPPLRDAVTSAAEGGSDAEHRLVSLFTRGTEVVVMLEGLDEATARAVSWPTRHTTVSVDNHWTVELREQR